MVRMFVVQPPGISVPTGELIQNTCEPVEELLGGIGVQVLGLIYVFASIL